MDEAAVEAVAKAINRIVYGEDAEVRWAQSDQLRSARKTEARAAIHEHEAWLSTNR